MKQRNELFLLAAEELNFTKAAKRAFVTQQCLSDHIHQLEKSYGVELFVRKPKLELTPYGVALQKALQDMKVVETNLEHEFQVISGEEKGTINFGINITLAKAIFPRIYTEFQAKYPLVTVNVFQKESVELEQLLLNGGLDFYMGINSMVQQRFASERICDNPLYCVMSEQTAMDIFGGDLTKIKEMILHGVELGELQAFPFILNPPGSTTREMIIRSLSEQNIYLNNPLSISFYETHFEVCRSNRMLTICAGYAIELLKQYNQRFDKEEQLLGFPIRNFNSTLNIDYVYMKELHFTGYMRTFMEMVKDEILSQRANAEQYLRKQKLFQK